jgi:hypothetical protein
VVILACIAAAQQFLIKKENIMLLSRFLKVSWKSRLLCLFLLSASVSYAAVPDALAPDLILFNGAYQDHQQDIKGSIEPGKMADLVVLGEDILTVDPRKISDIPVLMTIVGGKIVFSSEKIIF